MLLLGIAGRKGSGKDTTFQNVDFWAVQNQLVATRKGFADKLKWSVCRLFYPECSLEFAIEWANHIKNDKEDYAIHFHEVEETPGQAPGVTAEHYVKTTITGRELLQRYGTESHREVFDDEFWVDQILPKSAELYMDEWETEVFEHRHPDIAVITDVRFPNEAERVKYHGGLVWEVVKPDLEVDDGHDSEEPLPRDLVDRVIDNSGSLNDLQIAVNMICETQVRPSIREGSWVA